ncbi:hypothetical protein CIL03_09530 [Virgibacillus indicus]|uniref:DUF3993 domain-containing protein n=1 Tax=Virgibacillus indicus TaxID=2024554 RepID=A0A265N9Q3_9BACI|nr:hypothetical protein [Virgibacillus indicus]OZU88535.1 hypothetical protein CIL03_09530 [Virgibacillus indicus]
MKHVKLIFISGIIILLSLGMVSDYHSATAVTMEANNHQKIQKELSEEISAEQESKANITHKEITALTEQFMDILVQEIDEDYKAVNVDTKKELMNQFEQVTTKETAEPYVDFYYKEKADGLYILPTETPAWFDADNGYDVVQLKENKVKVVQKNQDEMFGEYTIELEFTYDNKWKITGISYL